MPEDYFGSINFKLEMANSLLLGSRNCWLTLSCNLRVINQDILENEDMRDVSNNEKSQNDPDRVGISEESASDLSDGENEEPFLDCFEEGSDSSRDGSTSDEMEDDY